MTSPHEDILAAAEDIIPILAAHAAASEKSRSLAAESVLAMERAGLWRLLTPKRWGGLEADFRTQVAASAILTKGDPAAGWLLVVINAHAFVLPSFPPKCQEEVFGVNPNVRADPGDVSGSEHRGPPRGRRLRHQRRDVRAPHARSRRGNINRLRHASRRIDPGRSLGLSLG